MRGDERKMTDPCLQGDCPLFIPGPFPCDPGQRHVGFCTYFFNAIPIDLPQCPVTFYDFHCVRYRLLMMMRERVRAEAGT